MGRLLDAINTLISDIADLQATLDTISDDQLPAELTAGGFLAVEESGT